MAIFERVRSFFRRVFRQEYKEPIEEIPETIIEREQVEKEPIPAFTAPEPEVPIEVEEIEEEPTPEEAELSKLVIFYERIRNSRIRRKVSRSYPMSMTDSEIQIVLSKQYDNGGNFVIQVESISYAELKPYEEQEIERGLPGSADVSP